MNLKVFVLVVLLCIIAKNKYRKVCVGIFQFGVNLSTSDLLIRRKILRSFNWLRRNTLERAKAALFCFIKQRESSEFVLTFLRIQTNW
jgi:hypothetical protein